MMIESDRSEVEGVRARKRRETLRRITEAGIGLFIRQGVDATTLDEIAAAAGISRRTFFHYFKSKDDILLSFESGLGEQIAAQVRVAPDPVPITAIRRAVLAVCGGIPADDMIALDRLMRSSPAVQSRKQASYVAHEATLLAALRERWPDPAREIGLRLVAMLALGTVRLASETFGQEGETRALPAILDEAFDALSRELPGRAS